MADRCPRCGATRRGGNVCGACGEYVEGDPGSELDDDEAPLELATITQPEWHAHPTPAPVTEAVRRRRARRAASDRVRRRALAGGTAVVALLATLGAYPRIDVAARRRALCRDLVPTLDLSDEPYVRADLLAPRVQAWADGRGLDVVPGTLRVRVAPVARPQDGVRVIERPPVGDVASHRWVEVGAKLTVVLRRWGYERPVAVVATAALALGATQQADPHGPSERFDDRPDPEGAALEAGPPERPLELTVEGSVTGLSLGFGQFLRDARTLEVAVRALVGRAHLGGGADPAAWKRARSQMRHLPMLEARIDAVAAEGERIREAVEVRFGLRVGRPWQGVPRALDLLTETLGHLREGRQAEFWAGLDRFEQWHHALLLDLADGLAEKGVTADGGSATPPPGPGTTAPAPDPAASP